MPILSAEDFITCVVDRWGFEEHTLEMHGLMASPKNDESYAVSPVKSRVSSGDILIDPFRVENLSYDGLDFTIGGQIYKSDRLLSEQISIEDLEQLVEEGGARQVVKKQGEKIIFEVGTVYYVLSDEEIKVPNDLQLVVDSKSTLGRLGCLCHEATHPKYFPEAHHLIGVIRPYVFPLIATIGESELFQAVLRYQNSSHMTREEILNGDGIKVSVNDERKEIGDYILEDKLALHFSTHKAYVAKPTSLIPGPIELEVQEDTKPNWKDYFEEIKGDSKILLEPGRFYLLGTKENISFGPVCGRLTRDYGGHLTGLWSQFAGIIHAGFNGEITLECMTNAKREIKEGDLAGTIEIDKLVGCANIKGKGSYLGQKSPRLPKVFKLES